MTPQIELGCFYYVLTKVSSFQVTYLVLTGLNFECRMTHFSNVKKLHQNKNGQLFCDYTFFSAALLTVCKWVCAEAYLETRLLVNSRPNDVFCIGSLFSEGHEYQCHGHSCGHWSDKGLPNRSSTSQSEPVHNQGVGQSNQGGRPGGLRLGLTQITWNK